MELPLGGGCMCGAVRYEITKVPLRVYACHCTDCQRVTGSAFSLGVVVSADDFRATGKERALAPPILAASGRTKRLGICPIAVCGYSTHPDPVQAFPDLSGSSGVARSTTRIGSLPRYTTGHGAHRSGLNWVAQVMRRSPRARAAVIAASCVKASAGRDLPSLKTRPIFWPKIAAAFFLIYASCRPMRTWHPA
jgi:hypothetical protein